MKTRNPHTTTFQRVVTALQESQGEFLEFLSCYIQIPSEAPKEQPANVRECQEWLATQLREWDWTPWIDLWEKAPDEPNLAVRIPGRSGKAQLMFNGHTDVVPVQPEEAERWCFPPYSGHVTHERIWGRGASDMKGGVAAFLWAAKMIVELDIKFEHDLLLTVNIGEESARPDIGVASVLERGYSAPVVINAEPSNLRIYRAAMGWFFFDVALRGKSTHPANRYLCIDPSVALEDRPGADANDKMRLILNALAELGSTWAERESHPLAPPYSTNMTLVHIEGGDRSATLAEHCRATYAVVFDPSMEFDEVIHTIRECINRVSQRDEWLKLHPPTVRVPVIDPLWEPMETPAAAPGTRDLMRSVRAALSTEPQIGCFPGPCDANVIAKSGVDTLIFGPGDLSFGGHGIDEYVPIRHLLQACKVYAHLILTRCCA